MWFFIHNGHLINGVKLTAPGRPHLAGRIFSRHASLQILAIVYYRSGLRGAAIRLTWHENTPFLKRHYV
ncbi:hypothetical protein CPter91_3101 [Collimonas pratensis]|uniref:Uncharacterized protein n=1 Tax=Collimonas pratensis TaxID=279113 RepID=A0A127Q625_9BURK|nr:hypothetical protein CPter91_3101 [Collimonas pratensis]